MSETELRIRIVGDPVLRKKSKAIKQITERHREILSKMARLMYEASGVGLAAPQVGVDEAMIVVDIGKGLYKLINPRIVGRGGTQAIEEGCLSVPGLSVKVKRAAVVSIQAFDETGQPVTFEADKILAVVLQHEIDHLAGTLIVDYVPAWRRILFKKKVRNV